MRTTLAMPFAGLAAALLLSATTISHAESEKSSAGALLTAVASAAPASASETHALQNKLQQAWVGKTVTYDAGRIIQVITEGGGVKLVSFPPEESAGAFTVKNALSYAAISKENEADARKLVPGDSAVVSGTVASVSAEFLKSTDTAGGPPVRLNVTITDAKVVSATIAPKKKKAATTQKAG